MDTNHRILVTDPLHPAGLTLLRETPGIEVLEFSFSDEKRWREALPHCEAWIVRSGSRIREEHLAEATALRVIGRAGVGVDNIDVDAATRRGVVVMNAPDANTVTTAELALAHLLALARNLVPADRLTRSGQWPRKLVGHEVEDKVLGILGLGRIGRVVARKARGLGMKVLAHDPQVSPDSVSASDVRWVGFEELLAESDFLSLHLPLTERTRHVIDARALARMKSGARLINCARGGLVDESALLEALESGHLAGAALDVFEQEPPPADHPLLRCDQVVLTPHLGASTEEAGRKVSLAIAEQVLEHLLEQRTRHAVNLPAVDAATARRLAPFLDLARRCGTFLAQWSSGSAGGTPTTEAAPVAREIVVELRGEVAEESASLLSGSFLAGFLAADLATPVNLVNASWWARERGITLTEVRSHSPREFSSLLRFRVLDSGKEHEVAGALFGHRMPRLVIVDGYRTEIVPEGRLLALRHRDRPGVIGRLGSALGDAGINIGTMHVSAADEHGRCITVLAVSDAVEDALLRSIEALPEIESALRVEFP